MPADMRRGVSQVRYLPIHDFCPPSPRICDAGRARSHGLPAHRAPSSLRTARLPGLAAAGEKCTECLIPVNLEQIRVHTNVAPTD